MVYTSGLMAAHTKVTGCKVDNMAEANILLKMVLIKLANGNRDDANAG